MKKIIILLAFVPFLSFGQNPTYTENYVHKIQYKNPYLETELANVPSNDRLHSISYFDGLGRSLQSQMLRQGGKNSLGEDTDLIVPMLYDSFGRESRNYLSYPISGNSGDFQENAISDLESFYIQRFPSDINSQSPNPFSESVYEASPLNRVIEQGAPGEAWQFREGEGAIPLDHTEDLNPSDFITATTIHSDVDSYIEVTLDQITFVFNEGWLNSSTLQVGQILHLDLAPYTLNVVVGVLEDDNGNATPYTLEIQNNYLVITSTDPSHEVDGLNTNIVLNINIPAQYENGFVGSGRTIKSNYSSNDSNEVEHFSVIFPNGNTEEPQLFYNGFYNENTLYKTIIKDENWEEDANQNNPNLDHTTEEFKDKQGRVVLKRTYNNDIAHDTYYIYDAYGNLSFVNSPNGSDNVLSTNTYTAFSQTIDSDDFIEKDKYGNPVVTSSGDVSVTVDNVNNTISVNFNLNFISANDILNGPIALLAESVPDMIIGTINQAGANYTVSVLNKFLHISGSGNVSQVLDNFTIDLPAYSPDPTVLNDLCYQYRYDHRNRLVEKKIPGKDWEYVVYDKLDRPILTQDALLRQNDEWLFTKYDALGRVTYTGIYTKAFTRTAMQDDADNASNMFESRVTNGIGVGGTTVFYSNNAFPNGAIDLLTINYYDDYGFDLGGLSLPTQTTYGITISQNTTTLPTGSKVRVLGTSHWITTITGYDDKARPIYVATQNDYLSTTDSVESHLDFVGKVIETTSSHAKTGQTTISTVDYFTYDHAGRLLTQSQAINGQDSEHIVKNSYDELGQLVSKGLGSIEASPLQIVDYTYSIRGWLKKINDVSQMGSDLFGFELKYNDPTQANKALYNGNISQAIWLSSNDISAGVTSREYTYEYDALNRITMGIFAASGTSTNVNGHYNLQHVDYDKNGNIGVLRRHGVDDNGYLISGYMDDLTYTYTGNQLQDVKELGNTSYGFKEVNGSQTTDYYYDDNGNLIKDANKDISNISYNHLNLPTQVTTANGTISYIYDASGIKLKKEVNETGQPTIATLYAGNYIYEEGSASTDLKFFNHPEGYTEPDGQGGFNYVYQYKDHLGNIRLNYALDKVNSIIIQEDFTSNTYDWSVPGNGGGINSNNNMFNITLVNKWNSTKKLVTFAPGETIHIEFDFENVDMVAPRLYVQEFVNGGWELNGQRDMLSLSQDGHYSLDLNPIGGLIRIYFEKGNASDHGTATSIKIDNLVITQNVLEVIEENNYYPFGALQKGYNNVVSSNSNSSASKFKHSGKELSEDLGLNTYDFGARNYDQWIGRWMNVDPKAEKYTNLSPFAYVANNVINAVDPNGELIVYVGGLLLWRGGLDQNGNQLSFNHFSGDVWDYWSTKPGEVNNFGQKTDLVQTFNNLHNDHNNLFISGSSDYGSQPSQRMDEGKIKAQEFHALVQSGSVTLGENEPIRIVSHSQGGAHAAGYAEQLMTYKDKNGESLYNVEVIYYITPHQGAKIKHPDGVEGFQFSHPNDAVSGARFTLMSLINGGQHYGKIQGLPDSNFFENKIFSVFQETGFFGNRNGHNVTDNRDTVVNSLNDFCKQNPSKCREISLEAGGAGKSNGND